jgi:hypothetical protein
MVPNLELAGPHEGAVNFCELMGDGHLKPWLRGPAINEAQPVSRAKELWRFELENLIPVTNLSRHRTRGTIRSIELPSPGNQGAVRIERELAPALAQDDIGPGLGGRAGGASCEPEHYVPDEKPWPPVSLRRFHCN